MQRKIQKAIIGSIIAVAIALAISYGGVVAQDVQAPERSLDGVWLITITARNCTTGEPLTAGFTTVFTFYKDTTMLASFLGSLTLERTAAHGVWRRDLAWNQYSYKFVHFRRNVVTGALAGKQESEGTLVLSDSGDAFTGNSSTTVFDAAGNPGTPGCSSTAATRFQLE